MVRPALSIELIDGFTERIKESMDIINCRRFKQDIVAATNLFNFLFVAADISEIVNPNIKLRAGFAFSNDIIVICGISLDGILGGHIRHFHYLIRLP